MNKKDIQYFLEDLRMLYKEHNVHLEEFGLLVLRPGPGVVEVRHIAYEDLDETVVEEASLSTGPLE